MDLIKRLQGLFRGKKSGSVPLVLIKRVKDDGEIHEYSSIEEVIADLQNDPNIPSEKIERLKSSFEELKNRTSKKIRNGEIINSS